MKHIKATAFLTVVTLLFYCCVGATGSGKAPAFTDHGKTMNDLALSYGCKDIEYENWEADDAKDSTLTVCFINSGKLPDSDINRQMTELKSIASKIRSVISKPEQYKSYYIIFAKKTTANGITSSSHTLGADIPGNSF